MKAMKTMMTKMIVGKKVVSPVKSWKVMKKRAMMMKITMMKRVMMMTKEMKSHQKNLRILLEREELTRATVVVLIRGKSDFDFRNVYLFRV